MSWNPLGEKCHWCGKEMRPKRYPSQGNHLFCGNACKMAHFRAFTKWRKRSVTQKAGGRPGLVSSPGLMSNAKASAGRDTSSPQIAESRPTKSNVHKR